MKRLIIAAVLVTLVALVLAGCSGNSEERDTKARAKAEEIYQAQLQRYRSFIVDQKFVEAYQVAQKSLRYEHRTKVLDQAVWLTYTGKVKGSKNENVLKRWDYVAKILALEKDPTQRQAIVRDCFKSLKWETRLPLKMDGGFGGYALTWNSSAVGFLRRFYPGKEFRHQLGLEIYNHSLQGNYPDEAILIARHFKLGGAAEQKAKKAAVDHLFKFEDHCPAIKFAAEFDYVEPRVRQHWQKCVAVFAKKGVVMKKPPSFDL